MQKSNIGGHTRGNTRELNIKQERKSKSIRRKSRSKRSVRSRSRARKSKRHRSRGRDSNIERSRGRESKKDRSRGRDSNIERSRGRESNIARSSRRKPKSDRSSRKEYKKDKSRRSDSKIERSRGRDFNIERSRRRGGGSTSNRSERNPSEAHSRIVAGPKNTVGNIDISRSKLEVKGSNINSGIDNRTDHNHNDYSSTKNFNVTISTDILKELEDKRKEHFREKNWMDFLKSLCFLLEFEDDCCSALFFPDRKEKTIYFTCNQFSETIQSDNRQKKEMERIIADLVNNNYNDNQIQNYECILNTLIHNVAHNQRKSLEHLLSSDEEIRKNQITNLKEYLFNYFCFKDPSKYACLIEIPCLFTERSAIKRIQHFVKHFNNVRFYLRDNYFRSNYEIISPPQKNVHSELRLLYHLIVNKTNPTENILIVPSKRPCLKCGLILQAKSKMLKNLHFPASSFRWFGSYPFPDDLKVVGLDDIKREKREVDSLNYSTGDFEAYTPINEDTLKSSRKFLSKLCEDMFDSDPTIIQTVEHILVALKQKAQQKPFN